MTPIRMLDTRDGTGTDAAEPFLAGEIKVLQVAGKFGVPNAANAVAINVTAVNATIGGHLTVFPGGTGEPNASTVNFPATRAVPNMAVVPLGTAPGAVGKISITNDSQGTVHVVVDIVGYYFNASSFGSGFHPTTITRTLDTRFNIGSNGTIPPGTAITVQLAGRNVVPANGATLVALNVAVLSPTGSGFVLAYPADVARPTASTANFIAGENVSNLTIVRLPASGLITFYNGSTGTIHLAADVEGYGSNP
jgi:hypothetical protein